jgi:hypothetical protein
VRVAQGGPQDQLVDLVVERVVRVEGALLELGARGPPHFVVRVTRELPDALPALLRVERG